MRISRACARSCLPNLSGDRYAMSPGNGRGPRRWLLVLLPAVCWVAGCAAKLPGDRARPGISRNIIIFVADGLRHDSVNLMDSPTLLAVRARGVHFANSHSLFPTLTTANASAIATSHLLGDTGIFINTEYVGLPIFSSGAFGNPPGSPTPFLKERSGAGRPRCPVRRREFHRRAQSAGGGARAGLEHRSDRQARGPLPCRT
jgi:Type I phosphodiesterase / nucleotide pyrophosphatase